MYISSSTNDRIKQLKKLTKNSKSRREAGLFLAEGIRICKDIPVEQIDEIYIRESGQEEVEQELIKSESVSKWLEKSNEFIVLKDSVFNEISETQSSQGVVATVKLVFSTMEEILAAKSSKGHFILLLERLQDPGNLGTIIRTAEASGVTGIILSNDSVDLYNPKVVRSTMSAIFRMPVYVSKDIVSDSQKLKAQGVKVFAAHLEGEEFYDKDFTGDIAFAIGNEGNGLSDEISAVATNKLRIPMEGGIESLNAGISTAVVCYEAYRQRRER